MKENVRNFMKDMADLMEKHEIERLDARDHGYGCAIYIHGGWKNGNWFEGGKDVTPEVLRDAASSE